MKIAELLKICICHEKDEWCVYVFNKIIGVTGYLLQNLTSKNAQFLSFFLQNSRYTKRPVPPVFRAACALAQTYGWTRGKLFSFTWLESSQYGPGRYTATRQTTSLFIIIKFWGVILADFKHNLAISQKKMSYLFETLESNQNYWIERENAKITPFSQLLKWGIITKFRL